MNTQLAPRPKRISYSWGRRTRFAPLAWRLWGAGLVIASLGPFASVGYSLLGIAGTLLTWEALHLHASSHAEEMWDQGRRSGVDRLFAFASGLCIAGAYLILSTSAFGTATGDSASRLPLVVLGSAALGSWLAWRMFSWWWHMPYVLMGSIFVVACGSWAIWLSGTTPEELPSPPVRWLIELVRLAFIFLAVGLVEQLGRRRAWSPRTLPVRAVQSVAFVVGLSALTLTQPPRIGETPSLLWFALVVVLGIATCWTISQASIPFARDCRWYRLLMQGSWKACGDVPLDVLCAAAVVPAVALAGFAHWTTWASAFAFGLAGIGLKSLRTLWVRRRLVLSRVPAAPVAKPAAIPSDPEI